MLRFSIRDVLWLTVVVGGAILGLGFLYDVLAVSIPYQDPTPEMEAGWRYRAGLAVMIERTGAVIGLAGLALLLVRRATTLNHA